MRVQKPEWVPSTRTWAKRAQVVFAAVLLPLAAAPSVGGLPESQASASTPPGVPGEGEIDGRVALGMWPLSPSGARLDPNGLRVVLVEQRDPGRALVRPAGTWFAPPPGQYRYWLEGDWQIQQAVGLVRYAGESFQGRGMAISARLVPAGRAQIPRDAVPDGAVVRSLHESSQIVSNTQWASEMSRWDARDVAVDRGVLLPRGRAALATFDPVSDRFLAIAAPVEIEAGRVRAVYPRPPAAGRADLVLDLRRFALAVDEDDIGISVTWDGGASSAPAFDSRNSKRIVAIWKDLPSGTVWLRVDSGRWSVPATVLRLPSGGVARRTLILSDARPLDVRLPQDWATAAAASPWSWGGPIVRTSAQPSR